MEKTGCKINCGAPTTLAVKGLIMMMIMMMMKFFNKNKRNKAYLPLLILGFCSVLCAAEIWRHLEVTTSSVFVEGALSRMSNGTGLWLVCAAV